MYFPQRLFKHFNQNFVYSVWHFFTLSLTLHKDLNFHLKRSSIVLHFSYYLLLICSFISTLYIIIAFFHIRGRDYPELVEELFSFEFNDIIKAFIHSHFEMLSEDSQCCRAFILQCTISFWAGKPGHIGYTKKKKLIFWLCCTISGDINFHVGLKYRQFQLIYVGS